MQVSRLLANNSSNALFSLTEAASLIADVSSTTQQNTSNNVDFQQQQTPSLPSLSTTLSQATSNQSPFSTTTQNSTTLPMNQHLPMTTQQQFLHSPQTQSTSQHSFLLQQQQQQSQLQPHQLQIVVLHKPRNHKGAWAELSDSDELRVTPGVGKCLKVRCTAPFLYSPKEALISLEPTFPDKNPFQIDDSSVLLSNDSYQTTEYDVRLFVLSHSHTFRFRVQLENPQTKQTLIGFSVSLTSRNNGKSKKQLQASAMANQLMMEFPPTKAVKRAASLQHQNQLYQQQVKKKKNNQKNRKNQIIFIVFKSIEK